MKPKNAETKQNKKKKIMPPTTFSISFKNHYHGTKKIIVADTVLSDDEGMIGVK